jgi:hypothetical protein
MLTKRLHSFMVQNISTIGIEAMTDMIHDQIHKANTDGHTPEGASRAEVREHIGGGHILNPSLQIAHILRSLISLKDTLHRMVLQNDEETGTQTIDAKNMAVYLKVISEIVQVYRTGEMSKMLFSAEDKRSDGGSS